MKHRRWIEQSAASAALAFMLAATACIQPEPETAGGSPGAKTGSAKASRRTSTVSSAAGGASSESALSQHNLIKNGTFTDGSSLPWTTSFSSPAKGAAKVDKGEFCLEVTNKGMNKWDAQMRHREMTVQRGHTYRIHFKIHASQDMRAFPKVGQAGPPFKEYWKKVIDLSQKPQVIEDTFTMNEDDDPVAEFAFHIGGNLAKSVPFTVCLDDVILEDPQFTPAAKAEKERIPNVLVNQMGYFPNLVKIATVRNMGNSEMTWELREGGTKVDEGKTIPHGNDMVSGETVQIIDFSKFTRTGTDFTLKVGNEVSHPFTIGTDLYKKMKVDALHYYYHNRSGTPIKMPYAGEKQWERPAGHVNEKGDKAVRCHASAPCNYTLDVTGGWYDAGDHGKYIVNGGISVWTLLNLYERTEQFGSPASKKDLGDGKLNIPEKGNGVPDLLDEVRWELEFEMKMMVPKGEPKEGMVHHKVHDIRWTALGLAPHEDPMERFLYPPSTAATLNAAANFAQAARIWRKIDPEFSTKCLLAAERAWAAAEANPNVLAPEAPPGVSEGGGPYDDKVVSDEFYWAAAELFITTKKGVYKDFLVKSPHFKKMVSMTPAGGDSAGVATSMTWQMVDALGTLSLATVPNNLPAADITALRQAVVGAADSYLDLIKKQGYRMPLKADPFPWGSNSFILNNAVILAAAYDFSGSMKYLAGTIASMDYVLGRNPMDQSYVSGYGTRPLVNPHHRFWSFQADNRFPKAPGGAVSGGPNSGLQDPYVQAANLMGCAPAKCFVDNIEAWSVNEITINWNAPAAWVFYFLDEKGATKPAVKAPAPTAAPAPAAKPGKGAKGAKVKAPKKGKRR